MYLAQPPSNFNILEQRNADLTARLERLEAMVAGLGETDAARKP